MSRRVAALGMVALAASLAACGSGDDSNNHAGATATLAVLETTDLHFNVRSYDYFKLAEDKSYGFERTATLVRAARKEFANTLLVDNGDTIQGTALADYEATINPIPCTQQLSMYKAMGSLGFDAGTLGNHEFNYGLPFLNQVLGGGLDVDGVDGSRSALARASQWCWPTWSATRPRSRWYSPTRCWSAPWWPRARMART